MDLQANTEQMVAFIERVIDNPAGVCRKCRKWYHDTGIRRRGVCKAYKAQTYDTDFCLKEFEAK